MDNKTIEDMDLIPLFKVGDELLIGLKSDFSELKIIDGLVIKLSLEDGSILGGPISLQKLLKFGYFHPVKEDEIEDLTLKIHSLIDKHTISEVVDLLLNPSKESVESLVWMPERLKNRNNLPSEEKGYNLKNTVERLVSIRHTLFGEALNYAMKNELRDLDKLFDLGDTYNFELGNLDNSEDINLQLLVDLIKAVEKTTASIANLNKIDLDEFDS